MVGSVGRRRAPRHGRRIAVVLLLFVAALLLVTSLVSVAVAAETTTTTDTGSTSTTDTTSGTSTTATSSTTTTSGSTTTATSTTTTTSTTISSTTTTTVAPTTTTTAPAGRVDEYLVGADRYATAILVSQKQYPKGAPAVVLAKGDNFPDALAAAPLAEAYDAPVLLTPSGGLTTAIAEELKRLDPDVLFFIGLPSSLKSSVQAALPAAEIRSLVGSDRYHTAVLISQQVQAKRGTVTRAVLVPGDKFPDALSVAPLAAKKGWPIVLTPQAGPLPSVTATEIRRLGVTTALVVGTNVKPPTSVTSVISMVGRDRYYTSALVAEHTAAWGGGFGQLALATGENYPDALVMGPFVAHYNGILLLTRPTAFSPPVNNLLADNQDAFKYVYYVGLPKNSLLANRLSIVPIPVLPKYPTLKWGSKGPDVLNLEKKLAALRYDVGKVDSVYDEALKDAVMAFQKAERLRRDGVAGVDVWTRLETARVPTARYYYSGTHVEIDLTRQVLFLVSKGKVIKVLSCATGASATPTPPGSFRIFRKLDSWRQSSLGWLYMPSYFYGGIAIHGSYSVPAYPASHGCVRIPVWATYALYYQMPIGTPVRVYR
jgi:N-acetylmuramoyl-L-alanine amidase